MALSWYLLAHDKAALSTSSPEGAGAAQEIMPILQAPDKGDGPGDGPHQRPGASSPTDGAVAALGAMPNIPHGPPFRLIDRVLHAEPERGHLVALRRLTAADALWPADQDLPEHALSSPPQLPVELPRPLIIEALCQAAACLNALLLAPAPAPAPAFAFDRSPPHRGYLVAISGFRFPHSAQHTPPLPGDSLLLWVTQKESRGALVAFAARATLHRGACDLESLRTVIKAHRQDPEPEAAPETLTSSARSEAGAVGASEEGSALLAAGRLLFAVTMA